MKLTINDTIKRIAEYNNVDVDTIAWTFLYELRDNIGFEVMEYEKPLQECIETDVYVEEIIKTLNRIGVKKIECKDWFALMQTNVEDTFECPCCHDEDVEVYQQTINGKRFITIYCPTCRTHYDGITGEELDY